MDFSAFKASAGRYTTSKNQACRNGTIKIKFRTIIKRNTAQSREPVNGSTSWMVYKHIIIIIILPPLAQRGPKNLCRWYHPSIILPAVEPRQPWITFVAAIMSFKLKTDKIAKFQKALGVICDFTVSIKHWMCRSQYKFFICS